MVLIQLYGGLSNQLFQDALGRRIVLDRDTVLCFESSAFRFQNRDYKLHHCHVEGSLASEEQVRRSLNGNGIHDLQSL